MKDKKKTRKLILHQLMKDMNDTFVFVGYSFQDENEIVQAILDELSDNSRWESVKEKYVIIPSISENTKILSESYKISHIPCAGDDFLDYVSNEFQSSYMAKLKVLGKTLQSNAFLKNEEPALMQKEIFMKKIYKEDLTNPQHPLQCSTALGEGLYKLRLYNTRSICNGARRADRGSRHGPVRALKRYISRNGSFFLPRRDRVNKR